MSSSPAYPSQPSSDRPVQALDLQVDLADCRDKAELLRRVSTALHFPDWFGHNWDALSDSLMDLSWLPAERYRLAFTGASALRAAAPDTLATLSEILDETAAFWHEEGVPFEFSISDRAADDRASSPSAPASPR